MAKCSVCREKYASFARAGAEKPLRCGGCRIAGDVDAIHKRCRCGNRPSFGPVGGKAVHCAGCRVEGDVDLVSKMCSTCDEVHASFAPPGQRPTRCAGCRLKGDVNVHKRMCSGCPKRTTFGPPGGREHRCGCCRCGQQTAACKQRNNTRNTVSFVCVYLTAKETNR
jgi:hypothetical protein